MRARRGITAPQRLALRVVGAHGEIGAGELAAFLHLHPATLTGILERLVDRGCLERTVDAADRRRARLKLTLKGRRLTRPLAGTVEAAVVRTLAAFPARDLLATTRVLTRLASELAREEERGGARR